MEVKRQNNEVQQVLLINFCSFIQQIFSKQLLYANHTLRNWVGWLVQEEKQQIRPCVRVQSRAQKPHGVFSRVSITGNWWLQCWRTEKTSQREEWGNTGLLITGSNMHLRLGKHRKNLEVGGGTPQAGLGYLPLKELGLRCLRWELAQLLPVPLRDARRWAPEAGPKCCWWGGGPSLRHGFQEHQANRKEKVPSGLSPGVLNDRA